jgi:hypothetical protein
MRSLEVRGLSTPCHINPTQRTSARSCRQAIERIYTSVKTEWQQKGAALLALALMRRQGSTPINLTLGQRASVSTSVMDTPFTMADRTSARSYYLANHTNSQVLFVKACE